MLVVLEGIDGSGKTTLGAELARRLRARGHEVVQTREPWSSPAGRELRELFDRGEPDSAPRELELFLLDRAAHVDAVVRPALERGAWVVQDRTFYSTAAYQGPRGCDVDDILRRNREVAPEPRIVVLLQLDPEVALDRITGSRDSVSAFETLETLRAVDRIYRELAARHPHFLPLDATRAPDDLADAVLASPLLDASEKPR